MAGKRRSMGAMADINVTPMVDIMLVLLIIFMVITPMLQKGVSVDMAQAANPRSMQDADKEDAVLLAVTRDGKIFLGTTPITLDEVTKKVADMISGRLDKTVYVKSDARAKYGDVVRLINNIRAAGVDSLGLLTEKLQRAPGAPATETGGM
jgi:biopolymer transport protein ExbD